MLHNIFRSADRISIVGIEPHDRRLPDSVATLLSLGGQTGQSPQQDGIITN
ncbi:MAG: hypothetical protein ACI4BD_03830 [Paludibacteraceae bacterium]